MLYEHNRVTYDKVVCMLEKFGRCAIIQATGTGKSYILNELINTVFLGMNILIVVPTKALIEAYELTGLYDSTNIQFTTYAGLSTCRKSDVIVLDELHRAGAVVWGKWVKESLARAKYFIGLTATPIRYLDKGRDVAQELFGSAIVYGPTREEAISSGILPSFDYVAILSETKEILDNVNDYSFEYKKRVHLLLDEYQLSERIKRYVVGHKKIVVFYPNIETLLQADIELYTWFGDNVHIYQVHSMQSHIANREQLRAFNWDSSLCVIKSVDMLNEGLHLEGVTLGIGARKTKSRNILEQEIGRILSASNKAYKPVFIDLVRNFEEVMVDSSSSSTVNKRGEKKVFCQDGKLEILISYDEVLLDINDIFLRMHGKWAEYEDDIIRNFYAIEGADCYVRLYSRSRKDVQKRAKLLGLTRYNRWTTEEDDIIKKYYTIERDKIWERLPGRTQQAIRNRANQLGLGVAWTTEDDLYILNNYEQLGYDALLEHFSTCTREELNLRLKRLGFYLGC